MLDMNQNNQDEVMSRWGMTSRGDEMVEIEKQQGVLMWQQMRQDEMDEMRWKLVVLVFGSKEENKDWDDEKWWSWEIIRVQYQGIWDETGWDEMKVLIKKGS